MSRRRKSQSATVLLAVMISAVGHTQPQDVTWQLPAHEEWRAQRYQDAATRTLAYFGQWLGDLGPPATVIQSVPWTVRPAPAPAGHVRLPQRWVTLAGDRSLERSLIAGVARRYWLDVVRFNADDRWLAGGLVRYSSVRAALEIIDSDHYASPEFFGGMVAFPVRVAPLASDWWEGRPPPPTFPEVEDALRDVEGVDRSRAQRAGRGLQTLERVLGRPVLDDAIGEFARRARGHDVGVAAFVAAIEDVSGRDLSWFFAPAFSEHAHYDYGIAELGAEALADGRHVSHLVVARFGDAVFSGTARDPVGEYDQGRGIEVALRFADGSEVREHWDGRARTRAFDLTSRAALIGVTVDPDAVLLLDEQWGNNRRSLSPPDRSATVQWSLLWMAWLQHFMLSMTAFV